MNKKDFVPFKQNFSIFVPEYKYSDDLKNVVQVGKIDWQAYLNSNLSSSLEVILDKFLPDNIPDPLAGFVVIDNNEVFDTTQKMRDLSDLGAYMEKIDFYKDKFNLDPKMSVSDIINFVSKQSAELAGNLNKLKGVDQNAQKKTKLSQESKELRKDGNEIPQEESIAKK